MTVFLAGGTGTPKLLAGARHTLDPADVTVVGNTGDDVELGGHLVCPDIDTVLFDAAGELDRETWWGIADDTAETHDELQELSAAIDVPAEPRFLPDDAQTAGRDIANWRRFSGAGEFMHIGDRDRAVHVLRTSLLDEGYSLTEVTRLLADAYGVDLDLLPMSDDPVASIIHTPDGEMHFQAYWVAHRGEPTVEDVEFRGADTATITEPVRRALQQGPVVVGPSNPVTSIGPMLALDGFEDLLHDTTVVAVSPFIEDRVFSGPAAALMEAIGYDPSTRGVADAYPFADAFVLDDEDGTALDRPVVRTDTSMADDDDAARVWRACEHAFDIATARTDRPEVS